MSPRAARIAADSDWWSAFGDQFGWKLQGFTRRDRANFAVKNSRHLADITFEMRSENRHVEVVNSLTNLATFSPQRAAIDLTHRFTFATATSYVDMDGDTVSTVVGDGLALVSADPNVDV